MARFNRVMVFLIACLVSSLVPNFCFAGVSEIVLGANGLYYYVNSTVTTCPSPWIMATQAIASAGGTPLATVAGGSISLLEGGLYYSGVYATGSNLSCVGTAGAKGSYCTGAGGPGSHVGAICYLQNPSALCGPTASNNVVSLTSGSSTQKNSLLVQCTYSAQ